MQHRQIHFIKRAFPLMPDTLAVPNDTAVYMTLKT
jgi:hypothetical protein